MTTEPKPTPEKQNPPPAPGSNTHPSPAAEKTGFFNRVQRELKPKTVPTKEQEIVVDMTPERTDPDEQT